jgi:hypothetical protein
VEDKIAKNIGFGLLAQAGVALGLAYIALTELALIGSSEAIMGLLIFNVITAAVLVMEFIGPLGVRFAVHRAGEANSKENDTKLLELESPVTNYEETT